MKPILKYLSRIIRSNVARLAFPYKVTFAVTYRCNLRCRICSIWKRACTDELSGGEIEEIFSRSPHFSWIVLTGGEIFLRSDLVPIVSSILDHCRDLCVLSFPTNGYDTDAIVGRIGEMRSLRRPLPRMIVTVSLDGDPATHDAMRGVKGSWGKSMDTFIELRKIRGVEAFLSMTISKYNLGSIDGMIDSVRMRYPRFNAAKDLNFNMFHASSHYFGNSDVEAPDAGSLLPEIDKSISLLHQPASLKGFLQFNYLHMAKDYVRESRLPVPCQALSASFFMDPRGDLYPCHIYDGKLGNIREYGYSVENLWNRRGTVELSRLCRAGNCSRCWSPCEAYPSLSGALPKALANYFLRPPFARRGAGNAA